MSDDEDCDCGGFCKCLFCCCRVCGICEFDDDDDDDDEDDSEDCSCCGCLAACCDDPAYEENENRSVYEL